MISCNSGGDLRQTASDNKLHIQQKNLQSITQYNNIPTYVYSSAMSNAEVNYNESK